MTPSGLAGKSALVTGGSRGIGRAIVNLLAGADAALTFYYCGNTGAASDLVAHLRPEGHAVHGEQADLTYAAPSQQADARLPVRGAAPPGPR